MKNENYVTIPMDVETFLSFVFGNQSIHGLTGHHPRSVWKKYLKKLIIHLEKCIQTNVVTDNIHHEQILYAIDNFKKALASPVGETQIVANLFKLCFLLMGDTPDNYRKKVVNRPENYMLNKFRSACYTQSPKQKADLIIKKYFGQKPNNEDNKEAEKVWLNYLRVYDKQRRHSDFIKWFRLK